MRKILLALLLSTQLILSLTACHYEGLKMFPTYFGDTIEAEDGISISPNIDREKEEFMVTVQGVEQCIQGRGCFNFELKTRPAWDKPINPEISNDLFVFFYGDEKIDWNTECTRNGTYIINYSGISESDLECIANDTFFIKFLGEFYIYPSKAAM